MRFASLMVLAGVGLGNPALAQNFTGTFSTNNASGVTVTMTLQQDANGGITGSVTLPSMSLSVQGALREGRMLAVAMGDQGTLWFDGGLQGDQLILKIAEPDENGNPVWDESEQMMFVRSGAVGAAPGAGSGNPLAPSPGNPLAPGAGAADPVVGTFTDGNVVLVLQGGGGAYQGQLQVGGQAFPVAVQGQAPSLRGAFESQGTQYPVTVQVQGGGLLLSSEGTTYQLRRQAVAGRPANPLAQPSNPGAPPAGGGGAAGGGGPVEGNRDPVLVGVWVKQDMITSGDASFTSEQIIQAFPDGSFVSGSGRAVAGGTGWSGSSGGGGDEVRGYWRTEGQILYVSGQPSGGQWMPLGRYYVEGARLLFTDLQGNREVWSRRQ